MTDGSTHERRTPMPKNPKQPVTRRSVNRIDISSMKIIPNESELDAFRRGEQAHDRGSEKEDNPYVERGNLSFMWECGWISANCKLVNLKTPDATPIVFEISVTSP